MFSAMDMRRYVQYYSYVRPQSLMLQQGEGKTRMDSEAAAAVVVIAMQLLIALQLAIK